MSKSCIGVISDGSMDIKINDDVIKENIQNVVVKVMDELDTTDKQEILDALVDEYYDYLMDDILNDQRLWDKIESTLYRTDDEIKEYMDEAFDKVWFVRSRNNVYRLENGDITMLPDIEKKMRENIDRICEQYDMDFEDSMDDWEYGYWSGILSTLRWVRWGNDRNFLDT